VTRSLHETAWAEDPPTRTCYAVSNIEVEETASAGEYTVHSVILSCRGRNEDEEDWLMARRKDLIRQMDDGSFRLARREIFLTQAVLLAKNFNIFL
jgi:ethylbenzene dioxygenase beta subunit